MAIPYTPGPPPSDGERIAAYLLREFQKISDTINEKVDASYGGLYQADGQFLVPTTPVPSLFNPWDTITPVRKEPEGVEPSIADGSLTILTPGVYTGLFMSTTFSTPLGADWIFQFAINGVPGIAFAEIDPSNQTDHVTVSISGIFKAFRGDVLTILISSVGSDTWDAEVGEFHLFRISPEQKG
jgi:hypothetical protein